MTTKTTMTHRVRGLPSTLVLAFGLLAWHGVVAAQDQADPFPELPADAAVGTGAVEDCTIQGVSDGIRCGVFRVWENRAAASGRTLDIHFTIAVATDPDARTDDPILFFFGGPGAAVVEAAPSMARALGPLHRSRDLLMVDLRGIGRSGALNCDRPHRFLMSRFGQIFDPRQLAACRDILSRNADLTQYTTPASVDDLEELRRWLGYSAVNLFGGSYGTRVSQSYMRQYPDAVRTVLLTGVTAIDVPGYVNTSPNLQHALDLVIQECGEQPACAAAYPDLNGMVDEAFAHFDHGPVMVQLGDRQVPFHAADLGYALRGLLYGQSGQVPYRIAQAARGEFEELTEYYIQRTDWIEGADGTAAGNHLSVVCAEDINPVTDVDVERVSQGTFLQGHVIKSYRAACDVWPKAQLPPHYLEPVHSDIPTLLVSGERDPVTPPSGAVHVAENLTHHLSVVVPNGGHGAMNGCILGLFARLVETGSVAGLDTSCVQRAPPTQFRLP